MMCYFKFEIDPFKLLLNQTRATMYAPAPTRAPCGTHYTLLIIVINLPMAIQVNTLNSPYSVEKKNIFFFQIHMYI